MNSIPFFIDAFINDHFYLFALFDFGCLPNAAFKEAIIISRNLSHIPIKQRILKLAKVDKNYFMMKDITYAAVDIIGRRKRLWGYVLPGLHYSLTL